MKPTPLKFHGPEFDEAAAEFQMQGGSSQISDLCARIHRDWRDRAVEVTARALYETHTKGDFDVETLTEEERFAICYVAGVPVEPDPKALPEFKLRTVPCGIIWTGTRFSVMIAPAATRGGD